MSIKPASYRPYPCLHHAAEHPIFADPNLTSPVRGHKVRVTDVQPQSVCNPLNTSICMRKQGREGGTLRTLQGCVPQSFYSRNAGTVT